MCQDCEYNFAYMAADFEDTLKIYRADIAAGRARETPGLRVADLAATFAEVEGDAGRILSAWYLAVAIERLMALEMCGVPT